MLSTSGSHHRCQQILFLLERSNTLINDQMWRIEPNLTIDSQTHDPKEWINLDGIGFQGPGFKSKHILVIVSGFLKT